MENEEFEAQSQCRTWNLAMARETRQQHENKGANDEWYASEGNH
jgi:hypothetical protein